MGQVSLKRSHLLKGIQLMAGYMIQISEKKHPMKETTENAKLFSEAGVYLDGF